MVRAVPLTRGGPNVNQRSGPLESNDHLSSVPAKLHFTSDKDHVARRARFSREM
jgi:hypothetical protein